MFLDNAVVARLTSRVKFSAQRRALDRLGYRYVLSASGEPLVRTTALDGRPAPARNAEPNWGAFDA